MHALDWHLVNSDLIEALPSRLLRERVRANADTPRLYVDNNALQIAVASMANAIKRISVARGYDVTRYTLQCFGGAGGQHACLVADALGMTRVMIHPLAGVLSALGMGMAEARANADTDIGTLRFHFTMPEALRDQVAALRAQLEAQSA